MKGLLAAVATILFPAVAYACDYTLNENAFYDNSTKIYSSGTGVPLKGMVCIGDIIEIPVAEGLTNGIVRTYNPDDKKLASEIPYKDGVINGILKHYHGNGKVKSETPYVNGIIHGISKVYYESGRLENEALMKNGMRSGVERRYYDSGKLLCEIQYKNNRRYGTGKYYRDTSAPNALQIEIIYAPNGDASSGLCWSGETKIPLTRAEITNYNNGFDIICDYANPAEAKSTAAPTATDPSVMKMLNITDLVKPEIR